MHKSYKRFLYLYLMPEQTKTQKIRAYRGFKGPEIATYPKILDEFRRPLTVSQVSELIRTRDKEFFPFAKYLFNHNLDTRDGIAYHPSGKIKLCLDPEPLLRLNNSSKLERGALVISPEEYDFLDGEEYDFSEIRNAIFLREGIRKFLLRGEKGISLGNLVLDYDYLMKRSENILLRNLNLGPRKQGNVLDGSLPLNRENSYIIGRLLDTSRITQLKSEKTGNSENSNSFY